MEVIFRPKPAFKNMLLRALQVQHFHGVIRLNVMLGVVGMVGIVGTVGTVVMVDSATIPAGRTTCQVPSICNTALAQSVIRPPGSKPKTSTSAPLMDSTIRTSKGADTVLAVMGSSKYITLITRR